MIRVARVAIAIVLVLLLTPVQSFAAKSSVTSLIPTHTVVEDLSRAQAEAVIMKQIERQEVAEKLEALGFSAQEAKSSLAALSDAEAAQIAKQMEKAQYGGIIVTILVVVVLVLLVIWLAQRI